MENSGLKCCRQKSSHSPKKRKKKTTTKEFSLNSPRFGLAAGISSRLHRPAWSGFNPASLSAWEMRNFAALEELDKHKERRPQRAEISQTSAAWQAGQPDLILEWWLLPPLHWYQLSSPGNPQKLLQTAVYRCIWTHKTSFKITAWGHSSFSTFIYFLLFCTVSYLMPLSD